jgi:hypothetical protein
MQQLTTSQYQFSLEKNILAGSLNAPASPTATLTFVSMKSTAR